MFIVSQCMYKCNYRIVIKTKHLIVRQNKIHRRIYYVPLSIKWNAQSKCEPLKGIFVYVFDTVNNILLISTLSSIAKKKENVFCHKKYEQTYVIIHRIGTSACSILPDHFDIDLYRIKNINKITMTIRRKCSTINWLR